MKLIKPRGLLIGEKKFQLIGPKGERSKEINLEQRNTKHKLHLGSQIAIDKGMDKAHWAFTGTHKSILYKHKIEKEAHLRFIEELKLNQEKNKKVLVVGPAKGYEVRFINERIRNTEIDTYDIINEIENYHKRYIKNLIVDKSGIENYQNKEMIGKYDGITAVSSAGYWTKHPERNILKMALMLRPGGVAVITIENPRPTVEAINRIFKLFKLDTLYDIKTTTPKKDWDAETNLVIKRK